MELLDKTVKKIQDPVFGYIGINQLISDLLETPEVQMLHHKKQLGLNYLVWPGAYHTRLMHSIEVFYIAKRIARHLQLDPKEIALIQATALLHDLGHGPFSHTLEEVFKEATGKDHMDLTVDIITGKTVLEYDENPPYPAGKIPLILKEHKINPDEAASLIRGNHECHYLQSIISSELDADQLAYLMADSYFTGEEYGNINVEQIISNMSLQDVEGKKRLCFSGESLRALEELFFSRFQMYRVYTDKDGDIADQMLIRATKKSLALGEIKDFQKYGDDELLAKLLTSNDEGVKDFAKRIKYRQLFKVAYGIAVEGEKESPYLISGKSEKRAEVMKGISKYSEEDLEKRILERVKEKTGNDLNGKIIIKKYYDDDTSSKPKIDGIGKILIVRSDARTHDEEKIKIVPLKIESPQFMEFLKTFKINPYDFAVLCPKEHIKEVGDAANTVINKLKDEGKK